MASFVKIESRHNPRFKQWKKRARKPHDADCPWVPVESWKAVSEVAAARPVQLLLCCDREKPELQALVQRSVEICLLPERLLRDVCTVESNQGVVAFFEKPVWDWADLPSRLLFLWRLADPGNLGALLRSARATGFGVVCGTDTVSCFNPKAVRASAGAVFFTPFVENATPEEVLRRGYRLLASTAREGVVFGEADWTPPLAVLIGNEGEGLPSRVLDLAAQRVHIPMRSGSESLNAAVAGSLLLYEAVRDKNGNAKFEI